MPSSYIERSLEPVFLEAVKEFPAVVLTGPRQAGKTTMVRHLFQNSFEYVSLERPDVRAAAINDPRSFLATNPPPVIFDEVQYAPELLSYIKEEIDTNRHQNSQFILITSQNLALVETGTESLVGRAAMLRLLPLSMRELNGRPHSAMSWEAEAQVPPTTERTFGTVWERCLRGGYPEIATQPDRNLELWHASYIQTCLERDIRALRHVGDLTQFQNFLRILAVRSGQLLNLTDVAHDLGVAVNTVKAWLGVLEATFQVFVMRPYYENVGKRLVKTPKIYFQDVGTLCYLAGLKDPHHAAQGPMGSAILETAVLSEIVRTITHRGLRPNVYFWRTAAGAEVDVLVETRDGFVPIEVNCRLLGALAWGMR